MRRVMMSKPIMVGSASSPRTVSMTAKAMTAVTTNCMVPKHPISPHAPRMVSFDCECCCLRRDSSSVPNSRRPNTPYARSVGCMRAYSTIRDAASPDIVFVVAVVAVHDAHEHPHGQRAQYGAHRQRQSDTPVAEIAPDDQRQRRAHTDDHVAQQMRREVRDVDGVLGHQASDGPGAVGPEPPDRQAGQVIADPPVKSGQRVRADQIAQRCAPRQQQVMDRHRQPDRGDREPELPLIDGALDKCADERNDEQKTDALQNPCAPCNINIVRSLRRPRPSSSSSR